MERRILIKLQNYCSQTGEDGPWFVANSFSVIKFAVLYQFKVLVLIGEIDRFLNRKQVILNNKRE